MKTKLSLEQSLKLYNLGVRPPNYKSEGVMVHIFSLDELLTILPSYIRIPLWDGRSEYASLKISKTDDKWYAEYKCNMPGYFSDSIELVEALYNLALQCIKGGFLEAINK